MQKTVRKLLRVVANHDLDYYDMYVDPNESFFAQLYLDRIGEAAERLGIRPPATVLEAGCQTGRLAIPFAQRGFRVTGIDRSWFALRRAKQHVQRARIELRLARGDVVDLLDQHPDWQFDLVVCAEVLYLAREAMMLKRLADAVRPGGLLCVSHRTRAFYLFEALRHGDLETAQFVMSHREGELRYFETTGHFNWQTEGELRAIYDQLGMRWVDAFPIDRFAWLGNLNPSQLTDAQRQQLLSLERMEDPDTRMCARYVCVLTQRP